MKGSLIEKIVRNCLLVHLVKNDSLWIANAAEECGISVKHAYKIIKDEDNFKLDGQKVLRYKGRMRRQARIAFFIEQYVEDPQKVVTTKSIQSSLKSHCSWPVSCSYIRTELKRMKYSWRRVLHRKPVCQLCEEYRREGAVRQEVH